MFACRWEYTGRKYCFVYLSNSFSSGSLDIDPRQRCGCGVVSHGASRNKTCLRTQTDWFYQFYNLGWTYRLPSSLWVSSSRMGAYRLCGVHKWTILCTRMTAVLIVRTTGRMHRWRVMQLINSSPEPQIFMHCLTFRHFYSNRTTCPTNPHWTCKSIRNQLQA